MRTRSIDATFLILIFKAFLRSCFAEKPIPVGTPSFASNRSVTEESGSSFPPLSQKFGRGGYKGGDASTRTSSSSGLVRPAVNEVTEALAATSNSE